MGANLNQWIRALPVRVMVVTTHGVCHGAAMALAAAQLQSDINLHEVELGFLEEPSREVIMVLITDFSATADAAMAAGDVGRVVRDAPHGE